MTPRPLLSLVPFPPLDWWSFALPHPAPVLDAQEPFQKMGHRNRYRIATATGRHWLTVPILGGREQHTPLAAVQIDNRSPWPRTHWRTLSSAYRRAPFFEHYEDGLAALYRQPWNDLAAFARASLHWAGEALGLRPQWTDAPEAPHPGVDCRDATLQKMPFAAPPYLQVFAERTGFLPNLSILDLLFCEGPAAAGYLQTLAAQKKPVQERTGF